MNIKTLFAASALTLGLILAAGANATTITFDEFAAQNSNSGAVTNQYAGDGVTFSLGNVGIWSGLSNGDPGNWLLEGTNGPDFLGFNGYGAYGGYSETLTFSSAINSFSADFARSNGSVDGVITLDAFNGATLVASDTGTFGDLSVWMTLTLNGASFDSVTWSGTGSGFHPYGVDNVVFGDAPAGVPEPAAWGLMLMGFGGLGAMMRSARRKQVTTA